MLKTGLYEQIIDRALAEALEASKDIYIAALLSKIAQISKCPPVIARLC